MQKLSFLSFEQLTPLWGSEETHKIVDLLNIKHSAYLEDETFELAAGYNNEQIQLKISLKKNNGTSIYPLEAICVYEDYAHLSKEEIAYIILDYIDNYWSEYFMEERDLFVPLDWALYKCEAVSFFLRGFVRDLNLEMKADFLLKEYGFGEYEISPISSET